jgi:hypothetical protein
MLGRFPLLVPFLLVAIAGAGCKQGVGGRCQVRDDCTAPLVCSAATQTCTDVGGGGDIDASVPDAPLDAPPDQ